MNANNAKITKYNQRMAKNVITQNVTNFKLLQQVESVKNAKNTQQRDQNLNARLKNALNLLFY